MFKFTGYFILSFIFYLLAFSLLAMLGVLGFWSGFNISTWLGYSADASNVAGLVYGASTIMAFHTAFKESTN